jgi:multidrug efflux pump subunit AcrA (membrane-fusion protein)
MDLVTSKLWAQQIKGAAELSKEWAAVVHEQEELETAQRNLSELRDRVQNKQRALEERANDLLGRLRRQRPVSAIGEDLI